MGSGQQFLAFDQRFLTAMLTQSFSDISVALVELVANAWDAYATEVDIIWPTNDGVNRAGFVGGSAH